VVVVVVVVVVLRLRYRPVLVKLLLLRSLRTVWRVVLGSTEGVGDGV
jgi:hypothetical protein